MKTTKQETVHCKKEKFDVYIGRPTIWGNPFSHKDGTLAEYKMDTRDEAIEMYEFYMRDKIEKSPELKKLMIKQLDGKILGCWCAPKKCHGDVLIKIIREIKDG